MKSNKRRSVVYTGLSYDKGTMTIINARNKEAGRGELLWKESLY
ncbi:hypothetical protein [Halalkalibacter flavus]